jgi:Putative peptidoglycan binding domain
MPRVHRVEDGEHLSGIAKRFGFQNALTIWNDPANDELRSLRGSPEILLPGDELHIPDLETKAFKASTGRSHDITVRTQRLELRLRLQDGVGAPHKEAAVTIEIGDTSIERTSNADGLVSTPVPRAIAEATIDDGNRTLRLRVGALDPATELTGWHARLVNLGYLVGSPQETEPQTRQTAIEEFEVDNGLPVTGEISGATLAKLVEVHGA